MKPLISVISVNYNGYALTCAMVESLRRHVTSPLEIIVVDNGSARDEAAMLRERYPEIKALRSERNLGFAGGNNLGFAAATGDYLLLLNNDTEVEDDTLHYLCETLAGNPAIGAVCPKIRFFAPPRHIQFAGYTPLTHVTLRNALIGFGMPDDGSFDTPRDTPYAHGAAMMVRREVPRKAGPMPDIYFLYYEELDWSVRIREQGWKIAYDPRCTVFHKESATSGQQSPLRSYYLTRNRLLFAWRNLHGTARMLSVAYQLCIAVPKSIAAALAHGRRDLAKAIRHGAGGFFTLKTKRHDATARHPRLDIHLRTGTPGTLPLRLCGRLDARTQGHLSPGTAATPVRDADPGLQKRRGDRPRSAVRAATGLSAGTARGGRHRRPAATGHARRVAPDADPRAGSLLREQLQG